jgi:thioredoxin reductase
MSTRENGDRVVTDRSKWVAGQGRPATHDVVIVGAGAAGLSAALVFGRARRQVAVIDAGAPRNAPAARMQGFLSRDGMPPKQLLTVGRAEVLSYGVEIIDDRVLEIEPGFLVQLACGAELSARRILIATGAGDQLPEIPGARERWGRDFLHCPYCHGWEVRDQPIGVLGTDRASIEHAHLLRQWSDDVVFFPHTQPVSASEQAVLDARGIAVVEGLVSRFLVVDDQMHAVELADGRVVPRTALFMRPTVHPHRDRLVESLGCAVDPGGFVQVDATGQTSVPGVWAAGNVANPRAQVITAAGEGSAAAIAINTDLVQEDIHNALAATHQSAPPATTDQRHDQGVWMPNTTNKNPPTRIPPPIRHSSP